MNEEERKRYWALFYTTIVGWNMHPGYAKIAEELKTHHAELIADTMLKQMEERWPTGQQ